MIVPEAVVHNFTYPVTCISIIANAALIFIILTTPNTHVGNYRYLLMAFSIVDICISIVHFVVVPALTMTEFGFIFIGFRFIGQSTAVGVCTNLLFVALFYQTFVLLAFHYVYRYVLLCNPKGLRWIGADHPWRNWIAIAVVMDILYIGGYMVAVSIGFIPSDNARAAFESTLLESYNIDLSASNKPGYLGIVYKVLQEDGTYKWSFQALTSLFLIILLFFGSGFVIVFCTLKMWKEMKRTNSIVANRTRLMQMQLFRALLIQTIVPTVTSYVPLGLVFVVPLFGISIGGWATVSMMSTALFPLIDPFLAVFLISGYRARLPKFLRKSTTSTINVSPQTISTQLSRS
ncbi:str-130 [Pristionchus pacificus]|uniref:Str-130 protein n=1 Tax=Pristionchus pacificus TaxID=54126 RepID=A0A2A6CIV7_PRIPA|nr:str-130 [Pristionchus pacificus]|eukprot:PDM77951.1 str-130 protein [Pristionchus pacificus]